MTRVYISDYGDDKKRLAHQRDGDLLMDACSEALR